MNKNILASFLAKCIAWFSVYRKLKTTFFRSGSLCFKKHPQAAESIVGYTFHCGVLLKQSRSQRRPITSARGPAQASLVPRPRVSMTIKRYVRERGIHALHSFGKCCRHTVGPHSRRRRAADQSIVRHPWALLERSLSVCKLCGLLVWYGIRTRDSQIIGLVLYPLS